MHVPNYIYLLMLYNIGLYIGTTIKNIARHFILEQKNNTMSNYANY